MNRKLHNDQSYPIANREYKDGLFEWYSRRKKTDISFLISGMMNLYEHQSTFNPNMPVRGLIYLCRLYEKYIVKNEIDIYTSSLKELPFP